MSDPKQELRREQALNEAVHNVRHGEGKGRLAETLGGDAADGS